MLLLLWFFYSFIAFLLIIKHAVITRQTINRKYVNAYLIYKPTLDTRASWLIAGRMLLRLRYSRICCLRFLCSTNRYFLHTRDTADTPRCPSRSGDPRKPWHVGLPHSMLSFMLERILVGWLWIFVDDVFPYRGFLSSLKFYSLSLLASNLINGYFRCCYFYF